MPNPILWYCSRCGAAVDAMKNTLYCPYCEYRGGPFAHQVEHNATSQEQSYNVHTWDGEGDRWSEQLPPIVAETPRAAYLAAQTRHPGKIVHVARVLNEPCSPGA